MYLMEGQSGNLLSKKKHLRWPWNVLCMDDSRLLKQAVYWEVDITKWKPGRPRKNWMDAARQDVKEMELTWKEVQQASVNREKWLQSVAQCVFDELSSKI